MRASASPPNSIRRARARTGAVAGVSAAACGLVGAAFGPVGAIVGLAIGGAAGYVLGDREARSDARDRELDRAIGIDGGDIGAAPPGQPPARIGAFSAGSAGASSAIDEVRAPDEGPIPAPEDDG